MIRLEFVEGTSSKFWECSVEGSILTVRFGRIGTNGQIKTKAFAAPEVARRELEALVAEKKKKGYVESNTQLEPVPTLPPPVKPSDTVEARPENRLMFSHERKKLTAWISCEGTVISWAEGAIGKALQHCSEELPSAKDVDEKRDELIIRLIKRGFEMEVAPSSQQKKLSFDELRELGVKAEREGDIEEAGLRFRSALEAKLGDDADDVLSAVTLSWKEGLAKGIRFDLDPGWIETSIKKSILPLLNMKSAVAVEDLAVVYESSGWWKNDLLSVLRAVRKSSSATGIRLLTFTSETEHFNSVDSYYPLPAAEFSGLTNLETFRLRATLVSVVPGKELSGLKHLYRDMTEITVGEFGVLSSGVWENLETLTVAADRMVLDIPEDKVLDSEDLEEHEIEDLATFRSGFERFLSGEAFPKLEHLVLRLPEQFTELFGDLSKRIESSALAKRLTKLDVRTES